MQISTAISDGVLAAVAFWSARLAFVAGARPGALGFALVALAALAGVFRFSVAPAVLPVHSFASGVAGQVGIPLIAAAFVALVFPLNTDVAREVVLAALLMILFLTFRFVFPLPIYSTFIGGLAAVAIVAAGARISPDSAGIFAIVGAIVLVGAGLGVGTKGALLGIPRVDIFHYLTALSMYLLAAGLTRSNVSACLPAGR